ncbi:MAG: DNA-binding response regulator, partial [Quisquiliibacterium sp.]
MPRHHFLTNPAVAIAAKPADRWCAAFPEGTWGELASLGEPSTRPDAIWIPVTNPQWAARVTDLSAQPGAPPVIVMSPVPQDAEGLRAINWGARGYCHLYAQPDLLQEVARAVLAGSLWVGPALLDRLVAAASTLLRQAQSSQPGPKDHEAPAPLPDLASLSAREREVADQVAQGKT